MRRKMMAGNWKMNKLISDLEPFFGEFCRALDSDGQERIKAPCDVLFALPAILLRDGARLAEPRGIKIAAQNIHWEAAGAYTGEVAIAMIKEVGVTATLIGHSERRQYFGETDATVAKKVVAALEADLLPIVCVGETLAERDQNRTAEVVSRQMQAILEVAPVPKSLVLAYEPVWAIGTGRSATPAQAQEVHALIRGLLSARYGRTVGDQIRILYGGSATPANIQELLAQADIDGGLVGGASLKPLEFAKMVQMTAA